MSPRERSAPQTNTTTFFFREREGLELIREHALAPRRDRGETTTLWSAGCGTGEEVYSLSIMAREMGAEVRIVGTDINEAALEAARTARYPERRLRHVSSQQKERWFSVHEQEYRLRRTARSQVHLMVADLGADPSPKTSVGFGFDVVLCRNVLMYLKPNQVRFAMASMIEALEPGGILVLGAAEGAIPLVHKLLPEAEEMEILSLRGATVARKRAHRGTRRADEEAIANRRPPSPAPRARMGSSAPSDPAEASPGSSGRGPRRSMMDDRAAKVLILRTTGDQELDLGRTTRAVACYQRALELDELAAALHFRLGLARMMEGAASEAQVSLRRCLFLEPAFWPAALLLADLVEGEDPEHARRYLKQARDVLISPSSTDFELEDLGSFAIGRPAALAAVERRLRRA